MPCKECILPHLQKRGHFKAHCFAKFPPASTAEVEVQDQGAAFLGTLSSGESSSWKGTAKVKDKEVPFKFDTGAEVTAISEQTYKQVYSINFDKVLYGPACQSLKVLGQFI